MVVCSCKTWRIFVETQMSVKPPDTGDRACFVIPPATRRTAAAAAAAAAAPALLISLQICDSLVPHLITVPEEHTSTRRGWQHAVTVRHARVDLCHSLTKAVRAKAD
eukprot:SAG22_NODE_6540_length_841_cov_1.440701_1_plen_106_part_01